MLRGNAETPGWAEGGHLPFDEDIRHGIELIRSAALRPERWSDFLAHLGRMIDGGFFALHGHDARTGHLVAAAGQRYDPHFVGLFERRYGAINPWSEGIARLSVGTAHPTEAFARREDVLRTEFYADWVLPQENIVSGAGLTLVRERDRALVLALNLRLKDQERQQPEAMEVMNAFAPYMREAFEHRRHIRLGEAAAALEALEGIEPAAALIVLNGDGRALRLNAAAERLVREARLPLDREGRLATEGAAEVAVARGLAGAPAGPATPLRPRGGERPLLLRVIPLPRDTSPVDGLDLEQATAIAIVRDPDAPARVGLAAAAELYGFSPAERALAESLCEGLSIDEHAEARRVSRNTVRNQLRAVMAKVGTARQGELVARLAPLGEPAR